MDGKNPEAMNAGTVIPVIAAPACVIYLVMVRRSMTMMPAGDEEWRQRWRQLDPARRKAVRDCMKRGDPVLDLGARNSRCGRSPRSSTSGRRSTTARSERPIWRCGPAAGAVANAQRSLRQVRRLPGIDGHAVGNRGQVGATART
jgi:hypothetical protein